MPGRAKLTPPRIDLPASFAELVALHPPHPIHDEVGHANAAEVLEALVRRPRLTRGQGEYLELLALLIKAYEEEHHPIDSSRLGPIEVLKHLLEENALSISDLGKILGDPSVASRVLSGHRKLSKAHIKKLAEHFALSTDLFI